MPSGHNRQRTDPWSVREDAGIVKGSAVHGAGCVFTGRSHLQIMSAMDAQIEGLLHQLATASQEVPGLTNTLTFEQFNWAPAPGRWSIGQCIEHLNITSERYVPVLTKAINDGRAAGRVSSAPITLGFLERWFMQSLEPPPRMKTKTPASFVAGPQLQIDATLARWASMQAALADCMRLAEGVDFRRIKVRSQFGPMSFSLGGTFLILLAHERRHLWQARQVRTDRSFPAA